MSTSTGNMVTFWLTCACGSIFKTVPSKVRWGKASTLIVTGSLGCTLPTSVSSTRAETCTVSRRSEEHTSELQSQSNLVCRLLLEKKKSRRSLSYASTAQCNYLNSPQEPSC